MAMVWNLSKATAKSRFWVFMLQHADGVSVVQVDQKAIGAIRSDGDGVSRQASKQSHRPSPVSQVLVEQFGEVTFPFASRISKTALV